MENLFVSHPWIIPVILIWSLPWKGVALWISARKGHLEWFIALIIINSLAILDILYIFIFSKWGERKKQEIDQASSNADIKPMIV